MSHRGGCNHILNQQQRIWKNIFQHLKRVRSTFSRSPTVKQNRRRRDLNIWGILTFDKS